MWEVWGGWWVEVTLTNERRESDKWVDSVKLGFS